MDFGALELQIFVSLVVVLGAAFVALVCDYLKGNNEQLREKNVELRVRNEERDRRGILDPGSFIPQALFEQFFAAARKAGWMPVSAVVAQAEPFRERPSAATVAWQTPPAPVVEVVTPAETNDREALAKRDEAMRLRVDEERKTAVVEVEPVSNRKPKKSAEDFVSPAALAKAALLSTHQPQVATATMVLEPIQIATEVIATIPVAAVIKTSIGTYPQIVPEPAKEQSRPMAVPASSAVREEIHRLKEQAKARFAAQYYKPANVITIATDLAPKVNHAEAIRQPALVIPPDPIEDEEDDYVEIWLPEKVVEIHHQEAVLATVEESPIEEQWHSPAVLTMQPTEVVSGIGLEHELNRVTHPATPEYDLLDQIIRISVEAELSEPLESISIPKMGEVEHQYVTLDTDCAVDQLRKQVSFKSPSTASVVAENDHDAILRELLSQNNEDLMLEDEMPVSTAILIEAPVPELETLFADLEPPKSFFTEDEPVSLNLDSLSLPGGMHDRQVLNQLLESKKSVTGVIIYAGINDYAKATADKSKAQVDEMVQQAVKLISGIVREKDFAARVEDDKWVMIFPGELGNAAQRRIDSVAEKFWDYQLRNLGQNLLTFSTGAVQVEREPLNEALANAQERMDQLRNKGRKISAEVRKKAVNG